MKPRTKTAGAGLPTRQSEFNEKLRRVRAFLGAHKLGGVLLNEQKYFAWATAGGENYVVLGADYGVGYLLITPDAVTVLASNIEIHRLSAEEFNGIGSAKIEFWSCPWYEDHRLFDEVQRRMKGAKWASDCGAPGSLPLPGAFAALTYTLTPHEIQRYRTLGRACSLAMEAALAEVRPGLRETQIAGKICAAMFDRGVRPHLALVAADERVYAFRHPIPTERKLRKHLMAVLCGKRGGLIVNLTRMVHFAKKLPDDLRRKHDAVCAVDVALNAGTIAGREAREVFNDGLAAYRQAGFSAEWKLHHQGGPTGYQGRSYRGTPTERRKVLPDQAYAWNPSIAGTKSEDTILVPAAGQAIEFLSSPTRQWPGMAIRHGGRVYRRADIKLA